MYTLMDKYTIKMEVILCIPKAKREFPSTVPLVEIVNAILYKFKTGVQTAFEIVQVIGNGVSSKTRVNLSLDSLTAVILKYSKIPSGKK